jgi:hypothetical protein
MDRARVRVIGSLVMIRYLFSGKGVLLGRAISRSEEEDPSGSILDSATYSEEFIWESSRQEKSCDSLS